MKLTPTVQIHHLVHQQDVLSSFSYKAIGLRCERQLIDTVAEMVLDGSNARFSKVLRHVGDCNFLFEAGLNWTDPPFGETLSGAQTPIATSFLRETPKLNSLEDFASCKSTHDFLKRNGVECTINVPILVDEGDPWGVLEVDAHAGTLFFKEDIQFVTAMANLMGAALRRMKLEAEAAEFQRLLMLEASHRVKNSLGVAASVLSLQSRDIKDDDAKRAILDTHARIMAIANVHDDIWRSGSVDHVELCTLLNRLCKNLNDTIDEGRVVNFKGHHVELSSNKAVSVALLVNELVTNAFKHAYADGRGAVDAELWSDDQNIHIMVRDYGCGISDPAVKSSQLGMRVIKSLTHNLGGVLAWSNDNGAIANLTFPLAA